MLPSCHKQAQRPGHIDPETRKVLPNSSDDEREHLQETFLQKKRSVAWADIDGACTRLFQQEPFPATSVPLLQRASSAVACFPFVNKVCTMLSRVCEVWVVKGKTQATEREVRTRTKLADNPGKRGYLWKLNADASETPSSLASIKCWRRRFFLLRNRRGCHWMMYLSEKHDGQMSLACALNSSKNATCIEVLPEVDVEPISPETRYWAKSSLQQYNVAFRFGPASDKSVDNESMLPSKLYPFALRWSDAANVEQRLVVASPAAESRAQWMASIKQKIAELSAQSAVNPGVLRRSR